MHVHGNYNIATIAHASASEQLHAVAQKRAEETRRKLAASLFALPGQGEEQGSGSRSGGQAERQAKRRREAEEGEFEHLFSALG
ncbi:MAG TPA: hypothetical protein VH250_08095 [Granulicella sp.]|jgi:hypothetical protein|nr:hypothetical protein [Granulicella sp.]